MSQDGSTTRAAIYVRGRLSSRSGLSRRRVVIDSEGKVAWSYVSPLDVNPGADGILEALEELERSGRGQTAQGEEHAHPAG
jgi:hypothetical protein